MKRKDLGKRDELGRDLGDFREVFPSPKEEGHFWSEPGGPKREKETSKAKTAWSYSIPFFKREISTRKGGEKS